MIKDIKLGLSLMKYGLNYRTTIIGVLVCLGMTVLVETLLPVSIIGAMTICMMPLLIVQLVYSVSVSNMVQTSSCKKRMQTTIPTVFAVATGLIANTIVIIPQWLSYQRAINNTNPSLIITYDPGEYESVNTSVLFSLLITASPIDTKLSRSVTSAPKIPPACLLI